MFMLCRLVHSGQIKVNIDVAHKGMEIDISLYCCRDEAGHISSLEKKSAY